MASAEAVHTAIVDIFAALTVTVAYSVPIVFILVVMCSELLLSWQICRRFMYLLKAVLAAMQQELAAIRWYVRTHGQLATPPRFKVN